MFLSRFTILQACVLLRNLAIESDHRLLLVKSGVVAAAESLLDALLRRTEKRRKKMDRKPGRRSSSSGDGHDADKAVEQPEERIMRMAMEFLENLCLQRHCRSALMAAEAKMIETLFRVVRCASYDVETKR